MIIDIVYAIVLILAFIHGYKKGIIHSIVSLVAIVIAIMAAVYLSEIVAGAFDKWFSISSKYLPLISFIAVFILIYLLFRLLEQALEGFFKLIKLNFINQLAGAVIWCVVWTMLYSTILFYLNNMALFSPELKEESIVYEKVEPFAPATIEFVGKVIPPVKNIFNSVEEWFKEVQQEHSDENESGVL